MRWTFAAEDPATPARAREAVREFAAEHGADTDTLAAVELCVSEAVNNAVLHAYRKPAAGPVEVEARRPDGYLCLYVRDQGSGLRRRGPTVPGWASACRSSTRRPRSSTSARNRPADRAPDALRAQRQRRPLR